jgi:class 3 adenylate cyclase
LVLVTDSTEAGEQIQELTQSRNELRLTRRRLAELSYRLDYLLRHYLSAEVADALLQGDLQPKLGGELREISILFADVRNFTIIAEQLPADQMVHLLNEHLEIIAGVVAEYDGLISQFQGDNLLVMFNASTEQPDHAQLAVECGIAIQTALATFQSQQPPEQARLNFGIGINTGLALVGNIGAKQRYSYTALGDPVNLAARITAAVPAGEVWFSQTTRKKLKNNIQAQPLPPITFKGKSQPTPIFKAIK